MIIHVGACDFPIPNIDELEENKTKYDELLNHVSEKCPNAQTIISGVLPRWGKSKDIINEQINDFNMCLERFVYKKEKVIFVDNDLHFSDHQGVIENLYKKSDKTGIPINQLGKQRLAASLTEALKEAIFKNSYEMKWSSEDLL